MKTASPLSKVQTVIGMGCAMLGLVYAIGASSMPSEAGYQGVGPNFVPWVVGVALFACGACLTWQALQGGFRERPDPDGASQADWLPFVWVSAALLLNAALIVWSGFIFSCALCFAVAVHGLHQAEHRPGAGLSAWLKHLAIGIALSAPVYWMFGMVLDIKLPGLTSTGWL